MRSRTRKSQKITFYSSSLIMSYQHNKPNQPREKFSAGRKVLIGAAAVVTSIGFFYNKDQSSQRQQAGAARQEQRYNTPANTSNNTTTSKPVSGKLMYKNRPVDVTKHGSCRMDCRQLRPEEVQLVLDKGVINPRKSGQNDKPGDCPTTALEGRTQDGQLARIVVADCGSYCKLVTVIDLETDFSCNCY